MGIKVTTPKEAVDRYFEKIRTELGEQIVFQLQTLGMEAVNRTRDRDADSSWIDRTGNLRSSIGAAVYDHGKKTMEDGFEIVRKGFDGSVKGKTLVEQLANEYAKTYALVVVAAMEYAGYVEEMNGKDVLASTEAWARSVIDARIQKAVDNAAVRLTKMLII